MSSDNAWYVRGTKVFMIDASDYLDYAQRTGLKILKEYQDKIANRRPAHEAESHEAAYRWANTEYTEYGIWWIDP